MAAPPDSRRDGEIEALLRATLPTPAIDDRRLARVRDGVHREWTAVTSARRRRRQLSWMLSGLAAAAALVIALRPWSNPSPVPATTPSISTSRPVVAVATVRFLRGEMLSQSDANGTPVRLRAGQTITEGVVIRTGDGASSGSLTLTDGVDVRIAGSSNITLMSAHRLELRRGRVYVDTSGRPRVEPDTPIEIVTPGAIVRDVGTRFLVTGGATLSVSVRDGRVQLDRRGVVHDAGPGERLLVASDGHVALSRQPAFGPEWDWIVGAAPPQPVDGRTLEEFLAWVEREGGRGVRFASPALGQSARRTIVYGTVEDLTVDEALAVVLPTCGLTHRVDDGVITIVEDGRQGTRR